MSLPDLNRKNIVVLVAALGVFITAVYIYASRTPTAPPGKAPAVPPADRAAALEPTDGMALPPLSAADNEKIKNGEAVEIKVGGGVLTIEAVKPGDQK